LVYTTLDGEIIKQFRKRWEANEEGCLDVIISEFGKQPIETAELSTEDDTSEE
jgi:hypothetical protein